MAAASVGLIESKVVSLRGDRAALFLPEPRTGFADGLPVKKREQEPTIDYWQEVVEATHDAVAEARHDPETAHSPFALASHGRRGPESLDRLRVMFAEEGIPLEFLSHYVPDGYFACRKQNDGSSDEF